MYPDMSFVSDSVGIAAGIIVAVLIVSFLASGLAIAAYILQSLGFYTIAQRRGIKNPWMAWLPVTNMWILGSISDQYQYVTQGLVRNRRKILVGLAVAVLVLGLVFSGMYAAVLVNLILQLPALETMTEQQLLQALMAPMAGAGATAAVMWVIAMISVVFQYICLYNLFASSMPKYKVLFLVLGILFNVTLAFFIFACRKKDLGMPPRKDQVQATLPPQPEPCE